MSTTYSAGTYKAKVTGQGFEESSKKGTPCFFLQFKVLGRYDEKGELQECQQYERTYRQYLANDVGVGILKGDLRTLGVEIASLAQLDLETPGAIKLVDREIDVVCEHEPYQGRVQERWSLPRPRQKKLDLNSIRELDDRFGHLLRGSGQATQAPPVVPNDSDVPF
jgi:hypothetical protein